MLLNKNAPKQNTAPRSVVNDKTCQKGFQCPLGKQTNVNVMLHMILYRKIMNQKAGLVQQFQYQRYNSNAGIAFELRNNNLKCI